MTKNISENYIYNIVLIAIFSLWLMLAIGYIVLQLYINPQELLSNIARWILVPFQTYLIFKISIDLSKLGKVLP